MIEDKDSHLLKDTMAEFEKIIRGKRTGTQNGAAFFAVCRGKVSEGLDFANRNGRAVVITGIPFPPRMEPKVQLKMEYLQSVQAKDKITGDEWYTQEASRAINQAVGRVLRHKNDYGAIILLDERFRRKQQKDQLPSWVKPHIIETDKFGKVALNLTQFFKRVVGKFGTGEEYDQQDLDSKLEYSKEKLIEELEKQTDEIEFTPIEEKPKDSNFQSSREIAQPIKSEVMHSRNVAVARDTTKHSQKSIQSDVSSSTVVSSTGVKSLMTKQQSGTVTNNKSRFKDSHTVRRTVSSTTTVNVTTSTSGVKQEEDRQLKAQKYLMKVKHNLTGADYTAFKKLLVHFNKQLTENKSIHKFKHFEELAVKVISLFGVKNTELIHGFVQFVPENFKDRYHQIYKNFKWDNLQSTSSPASASSSSSTISNILLFLRY